MFDDSFPQICKIKTITYFMDNCYLSSMVLIISRNSVLSGFLLAFTLHWWIIVASCRSLLSDSLVAESDLIAPICTLCAFTLKNCPLGQAKSKLQLNPQFCLASSLDLFCFPHSPVDFNQKGHPQKIPGAETHRFWLQEN